MWRYIRLVILAPTAWHHRWRCDQFTASPLLWFVRGKVLWYDTIVFRHRRAFWYICSCVESFDIISSCVASFDCLEGVWMHPMLCYNMICLLSDMIILSTSVVPYTPSIDFRCINVSLWFVNSVVKIGHGGQYGGAIAVGGDPPPRNFAYRSNLSIMVKIGWNRSKRSTINQNRHPRTRLKSKNKKNIQDLSICFESSMRLPFEINNHHRSIRSFPSFKLSESNKDRTITNLLSSFLSFGQRKQEQNTNIKVLTRDFSTRSWRHKRNKKNSFSCGIQIVIDKFICGC